MLQHCFASSIRQTLDQLPETLDETYARVLSQIPQVNRTNAHRMLQCLMVAVRPLRVEELAEVLAFEFGTAHGSVPKYRADWRPSDQVQAVLSTCSSLIAIVDDYNSRVVQYSHFSVKEFLMSDRLTSSLGDFSRYQIIPGPAHTILAQTCLGFLLHLDDHVDRECVKGFPLAKYAAQHWVTHAQFENVASHVKDGMESLFDCNKSHFAAWVRICNIDQPHQTYWKSPLKIPTPLYYSSLCGFSDLVELLAHKHPQQVDAIGGRYEFPLRAALFMKHLKTAEILLKHGANVNIRGMGKRTPLHDAITGVNTVRLLLNHGADVNCQQYDLRTPIHLVACYGDLEVAQALLEHKAEVNCQDNEGKTPLHLLFEDRKRKENAPDFARLLLEHGADANKRDEDNNTPLHLAMEWWMYKCARILLEHGADANVKNNMGKTPLHQLFEEDFYEDDILDLTRLSIQRGADVNILAPNKWTLLHSAAFKGWLEIVRMLLDHGSNVSAENELGESPLHLVSQGEYPLQEDGVGIARLFLERGVDFNGQKKNKWTPLHSAAFGGKLGITQVLLNHGANPNVENEHGETPMHLLSQGKYGSSEHVVGIARLLLERGMDVDTQDQYHETALHSAAFMGRLEIAKALLEHGADVNAENKWGQTPLHLVSRGTYISQDQGVSLVRLLLEHGVDVHAQDTYHETALHSAAFIGRLEIARVLLDHGAGVSAQNEEGETPLDVVTRGQYPQNGVGIARLLLEHANRQKDGWTPLHSAAFNGNVEIAQVLLDHGAIADAENEQGESPLHIVARRKYPIPEDGVRIAQLLLENGADVNRGRRNKWTPLHSAAFNRNLQIAQVLLGYGANPNLENEQGETPLHLVSRGEYHPVERDVSVTLMLPGHGVDVNALDNDQNAPSHSTTSYIGRTEIAQVLLDHGAKTGSKNDQAQTPLHLVSQSNHWFQDGLGLAKLLLERGADMNAQDEDNGTPLHLACYRGRLDIARILLDYDAKAEV